MHYVYLTDNIVTDQAQVDPFTIFSPSYAEGFIEAADEVTFGWRYENGAWIPPYVPPIDWVMVNAQTAQSLLSATDWTELPSVSDPTSNPHLLNKADFIAYRDQVRAVAVNPPDTEWTPPVKPVEHWSN